jgi:hypothetical protein
MEYGEKYTVSGFATGNLNETIGFDHDTTPSKQLGYACRGCLEYYDIGCMYLNPKGYSNGICKICEAEHSEEYEASPEGKAVRKEYNESPEGKARKKKYKQSPKGKANDRRKNCKRTLLKMIHKDLYADLYITACCYQV